MNMMTPFKQEPSSLISGMRASADSQFVADQFTSCRILAHRIGLLTENGKSLEPTTSIFSRHVKIQIPDQASVVQFKGTEHELLGLLDKGNVAVAREARLQGGEKGPILKDAEGYITVTDNRFRPSSRLSCPETQACPPIKIKIVDPAMALTNI